MPLAAAVPAPGLLASAAPLEAPVALHSEDWGAAQGHAPGLCLQFQVEIVGTGVEFDPYTGLPRRLEGDVFYVGGRLDGRFAGTYQEDITPLLDPVYGFVGADGVGVFTFQAGRDGNAVAELTIQYRALIVGLDPTGAMIVQSEGVIVGGAGLLSNVSGEFASSSTVAMYPEFAMHVDVNLSACRMLPFSGAPGQRDRIIHEHELGAPHLASREFPATNVAPAKGIAAWSGSGHNDARDRVFADASHEWLELEASV